MNNSAKERTFKSSYRIMSHNVDQNDIQLLVQILMFKVN